MSKDLIRRTRDSRAYFCALHPYITEASILAPDVGSPPHEADRAALAQRRYKSMSDAKRERAAARAERVMSSRVAAVIGRCAEACERANVDPDELDPDTLAVVALAWPMTLAPANTEAA